MSASFRTAGAFPEHAGLAAEVRRFLPEARLLDHPVQYRRDHELDTAQASLLELL